MSREAHILGVAEMAEDIRLRLFPHLDKETVCTAALLHDCTKKENQEELMRLYGLDGDGELKKAPAVVHAFTGAEKAYREGHSAEIANAIRYHTTGRENMTDIEKVVFIADYIEKNRKYDTCVRAREAYLDGMDADSLLKMILGLTIEHLKEKGAYIHPLTLQAYEFYSKEK